MSRGRIGKITDSTEQVRPQRVDAQRNAAALIDAARIVFERFGVDAPAKEITDLTGVGVGTLYRHFPRRTDLILAVLHNELDACVAELHRLQEELPIAEALTAWVVPVVALVTAKHGLAAALHSGDPAYEGLSALLLDELVPALKPIFERAAADGIGRSDITALEALTAVALLCQPVLNRTEASEIRLPAVFADGLRLPPRVIGDGTI